MKRPLMCFCILLMLISILRFYVSVHGAPPGELPEEAVTLQGRLDSWEVESGHTILSLSDVFFYDGSVKKISDNSSIGIRCYIKEMQDLKLGQTVAVQGFLAFPKEAGNQGGFDAASYYQRLGYEYVLYEGKILAWGKEYDVLLQFLYECKCYATTCLNACLQKESAGIMSAMLLGDKTGMNDDTKQLYRSMGVYHILAISGLHISLMGGLLYKLLKKLRIKPVIAVLISMGFLILYGIMIGMPPSALRAIIMFGFGLSASLCNRSHDRFTSLSVAGACLLLWNPALIEDAGVQLSFLAVLGIIGLYPTFLPLHQQHMKMADGLWVSFAVTYMTLPVLMRTYYEIPTYSLIINLCIVPLVPLLIVLGLLIVIWGSWLPVMAKPCGWMIEGILLFYEKILLLFRKLPGNTYLTGTIEWYQLIIFYVASALLIKVIFIIKRKLLLRSLKSEMLYTQGEWQEYRKEQKSIRHSMLRLRIFQGIVMLILVIYLIVPKRFDCCITFLDVGQGDGICIEAPRETYLIDCGSTSESGIGEYTLLPFLKYRGIDKIDGWFLTHSDSDHVSGFREVCEMDNMGGIEVERLYIPHALEDEFTDLIVLAKEKGIDVTLLKGGDRLDLGGFDFTVLSPGNASFYENENDASLVLYLQYGDFSSLFMGDAGKEAEQTVCEMEIEDVTLLKVAHHGSAIETNSWEFIHEVSPRLAVISCGINNSYNHPHKEVLEALEISGSAIYRTDKQGQISVVITGNKVRVKVL